VAPPSESCATSIGPIVDSQQQPIVEVLARAFCDNPLNRVVVQSDDPLRRFRSHRESMQILLPTARQYGEVLVATRDGNVAGGLIAAPPGGFPLPPPPVMDRLKYLIRQGWSIAQRWERVFEALDGLHPIEPHWYLAVLGVDRSAQRRGLGAALLSHWLRGVDRDAMPAYLETDGEDKIGFYERAGFSLAGEISVLGVPIWQMKRPAATRSH
jgi:ribosomal protein S18 acetylase RimI-like enzyme